MKPHSSIINLLLSVLLGVVLASCRGQATPTPERPAGSANSVIISTFTPAPTSPAEASVTELADEASTSTPSVTGRLAGLAPMNVTVNLEQRNFICTVVKKGPVYYERTCTKGLPEVNLTQVVISGRETSIIDFIETSVYQKKNPDPMIAGEILGFIASMPYEGAVPKDAKLWVESTIPALGLTPGHSQEASFGGVKYVLHGSLTKLILEIGELP